MVAVSSTIESSFERTKRDLSNKPSMKKRRKKKEISLDISLSKEKKYDTDVLTEGLHPVELFVNI